MNQIFQQREDKLKDWMLSVLCLAGAVFIILACSGFISFARTGNQNTGIYKFYTSVEVAPGDTLWDLAHFYMTKEYSSVQDYIAEMKHLNRLTSDTIHEGRYLTIPYYSSRPLW